MDVWRLLAAARRRWYVLVPLLLLSLGAAASVGSWVGAEHQTKAVVGVTPSVGSDPAAEAGSESENPYRALSFTAGVLEHILGSSAVREELRANGLSDSYQITALSRSSFIGIEVTSDDPDQAVATGRALIGKASQELTARQDRSSISPSKRVSVDVLDDADNVAVAIDGQIQALAAVLAVGGVLSFLATVVIDDLLRLRRRRDDDPEESEPAQPDSNRVPGGDGVDSARIADSPLDEHRMRPSPVKGEPEPSVVSR